MSMWLSFVLAGMSATFAWQAFRGLSRGSTNLPLSILSIEEIERDSTYFWGVVSLNVVAALVLAAAAVLAYLNDWGAIGE